MNAHLDAPAPDVTQSWAAMSSRRLDWAFRAYRLFVDGLSTDTRERFAKGDEQGDAYVVLFGNTQVGKTTLLLELMGLTEPALARVSQVLRGGRTLGNSATATAMEYRRSVDDHWRLDAGGGVQTHRDDEAMEKALGGLRICMQQQRLAADRPAVVWIPAVCFASEKDKAAKVRILDLPGDSSDDPVEREHVQRMARAYVPHADLILLVGRGDALSFLHPHALELPSISDWQIVPGRFRIVTTYSFTAQSVRDQVRDQVRAQSLPLDPAFFRQRLLEQIRTFNITLNEEAAMPSRFFPLEFGDSWAQAGLREHDLVDQLEPVIAELKQQLHADIAASTSEIARLRNAVDVHVVVGKVMQARLTHMESELAVVRDHFEQVRDEMRAATTAAAQAQQRLESTQRLLAALPIEDLRRQVQLMTSLDIDLELKLANELEYDASKFKDLINIFTTKVKRNFLDTGQSIASTEEKKFWGGLQPRLENHISEAAKLAEAEFSSIRKKLAGYWFDTYFENMFDNFKEDQKAMLAAMQASATEVGELARKLWWDVAERRLAQHRNEMQSCADERDALSQAADVRREEHARLQGQIDAMKHEQAAFIKRMELDAQSSSQFVALLDREYLTELMSKRQDMEQASNSTIALLNLLAVRQLIEERNKVMIGIT